MTRLPNKATGLFARALHMRRMVPHMQSTRASSTAQARRRVLRARPVRPAQSVRRLPVRRQKDAPHTPLASQTVPQAPPLHKRPRNVPPFWVRVPAHADAVIPRRTCLLVLAARHIPCLSAGSQAERLYVPLLYAHMAAVELRRYAHENRPLPPPPPPVTYRNTHWMLFVMLALVVWHGLTAAWWDWRDWRDWGSGTGPTFADWKQAGSLDVFRTAHVGEWWRTLTALTLHSDSRHLFGNVAFGAPFLILLGRRVGVGPALLLTVLAGATGNVCNALYRPPSHDSLGFSTALFAVVGVVSALIAVRVTGGGRILLPLAAGVGILASLGTGGGELEGRIDYGAHVFGLLSGLVWGVGYGLVLRRVPSPSLVWRTLCGVAAAGGLGSAWILGWPY